MESILLVYCLVAVANALWCVTVSAVIGKQADKVLIAVWCIIPIIGQLMFISSLVVSYDYENIENQAAELAKQLAEKLNWHGQWIGGAPKEGYVFVIDAEDARFFVWGY